MIQDQETTGSLDAVGLDSSSVVSEDLRVPLPLDIDETDDVSENLFGVKTFWNLTRFGLPTSIRALPRCLGHSIERCQEERPEVDDRG